MKVWIDQELCTGDGQCADICPDIFFMHDDGVSYRAYVKRVDDSADGPSGEQELKMAEGLGAEGLSDVPRPLKSAVREAAQYCPGECIFVERG